MDTENLHVHQFKETVVPPTCKESGYTLYTCDCGYEHKTNFKPVAAHSFQITETTPATCNEPGSITSVCTACGESNTRIAPALGHNFSNWIVKSYPTCTEPGTKIRKCSRCAAVEESGINPTGHRCAPQTARYANGKLVEFFCENCGQTIQPSMVSNPVNLKTPGYWPTKILLLLTAIATLLEFVFMVLWDASPNAYFYTPWRAYSFPWIIIVCCILGFIAASRIKRNERYPRLLGVATLVLLIFRYILMFLEYLGMDDVSFYLARILTILIDSRFGLLLLLTVVFFCGVKKKNWLFVVVLSCSITYCVFQAYTTIRTYRLHDFGEWYMAYIYTGLISDTLLWTSLAMLVKPAKTTNQISEPVI